MDDLYRTGFARLLAEVPSPPLLDDLRPTRAAVPDEHRRAPRSVRLAFTILGATVLIALPLVVFIGDEEPGTPAGDEMVPYVRIDVQTTVEHACMSGVSLEDNGGFDTAVVEVWGPTDDGLLRVDATAPDGTVERTISQGVTPDLLGSGAGDWETFRETTREWSTLNPLHYWTETVFRIVVCRGHQMAGGVTGHPGQHPFLGFVGLPRQSIDGTDYLEAITSGASRSSDRWNGAPVIVYRRDHPEGWTDMWLDPVERRWERWAGHWSLPGVGRVDWAREVTARGEVPLADVSFSTDDLLPSWFGGPMYQADEDAVLVPYVRLRWEATDVHLECADRPYDNSGSDSAVIEIYGPGDEGLIRVDMTAPNGAVETYVMADAEPGAGIWLGDVWSNRAGGSDGSPFRAAWCAIEHVAGSNNRTVYTVVDGPAYAYAWHLRDFIAITGFERDVLLGEYPAPPPAREDDGVWRGTPVIIRGYDGPDGSSEIWYDPVRLRWERTVYHRSAAGIGSATEVTEVLERSLMPVPPGFFTTDGLRRLFSDE